MSFRPQWRVDKFLRTKKREANNINFSPFFAPKRHFFHCWTPYFWADGPNCFLAIALLLSPKYKNNSFGAPLRDHIMLISPNLKCDSSLRRKRPMITYVLFHMYDRIDRLPRQHAKIGVVLLPHEVKCMPVHRHVRKRAGAMECACLLNNIWQTWEGVPEETFSQWQCAVRCAKCGHD